MKKELACVVLAAGEGTRMKSTIPKVLHRLNGIPMIHYVLRAVSGLGPERVIVVAGRDNERVLKGALKSEDVRFALQKAPLGTAHALMSAVKALRGFQGDVLVVNGDTPLVGTVTLRKFITKHRRARKSLSLLSFIAEDPTGYGRILRDKSGTPLGIREEKDATEEERKIEEVNSGIYLFKSRTLTLLKKIGLNSKKGEYYLTDILEIASQKGLGCGVCCSGDEREFMGINTMEELLKAQRILREKTVRYWLERDVSFMDETAVYIHPDVVIGEGTHIYPNVYLEGKTSIGSGCVIYPDVRITDSTVGDGVTIKDSSVIESAEMQGNTIIGPFARLRPGAKIMKDARIGNFVEVKASTIGEGAKAQHLSYIGDADVGRKVNIGAGTITCNYDGVKKHRTVIEDDVFIGSDTQLVAPVRVEKGAYVGAGSTITKDVPSGALAISRSPERHIKGWAKKRKKKK
ncbi:N-acetylglucosamine-1-phosphate uridyltransferase / Glucosamine-1-phosphate N-acetyltransferase [hydrothermal vent metagenome]|uniref:N-acetylglucosamine-1-phosphate uridyltransferase / Glucosamine-1-phosphate N-acetyltransferase n=1 Tax=hydrothermal vent metagenome TaxID=652676 RepID=A0A3B1DZJ8_9ZZZZ